MAQHGSGPPRYTGEPAPGARGRQWSPADPEPPGDLPPWAIPQPVRPPRRASQPDARDPRPAAEPAPPPSHREGRQESRQDGGPPPGRSRAQAARGRRNKRRGVTLTAVVAVAAVIAVGIYLLLPGGSSHPASSTDGLVTTFQHGELRTVPNTCDAVSQATLSRYLPGKLARVALPALSGSAGNQCDWTLDHRPVYLLLDVTAQAYSPSGLASGDGSATNAAQDAYQQDLQAKQHPAKATHQPPSQILTSRGLGQQAFSAFQVINGGGNTTYRVTLVARYRNVLVTVEFGGLDHSTDGRYGPVTTSTLVAGAKAAAQDVLSALH